MLRKAKPTDAPQIADLYIKGSQAAYGDFISSRFLKKLNPEEQTQEYAAKIKNKANNIYVSEEKGTINGFMAVAPRAKSLELLQIYIDPRQQNQGLGRKFMFFLEDLAKRQNLDKIKLWVLKDNQAAIAFYQKMGFSNDQKERFLPKYQAQQISFSKLITHPTP